MIDFSNQVAIVTGAGRGIGRDIALELAARGASVLVNDYGGDIAGNAGSSREAEAVVDEIRGAGGTAEADATTVGDSAGADAILDATLTAFGRVDILINNAGAATIAPIDKLSDDDIERVMRTNYWGPYLLIRRVWPHMRSQNYGRILNVSSSATLGVGSIAAYSSSKSALIGLTMDAAIEGRPDNILVSGIFPFGYTRIAAESQEDTRVWLEQNFPSVLVARTVVYFVSREMGYSGDIYGVGGGRVSRFAFFNNDGYFNHNLTEELVGENIETIQDMTSAVHIASAEEETMHYMRWLPWTGGRTGMF